MCSQQLASRFWKFCPYRYCGQLNVQSGIIRNSWLLRVTSSTDERNFSCCLSSHGPTKFIALTASYVFPSDFHSSKILCTSPAFSLALLLGKWRQCNALTSFMRDFITSLCSGADVSASTITTQLVTLLSRSRCATLSAPYFMHTTDTSKCTSPVHSLSRKLQSTPDGVASNPVAHKRRHGTPKDNSFSEISRAMLAWMCA